MADITHTTQEIIKLKQAAKDPNERHQRMNTLGSAWQPKPQVHY